MAAVACTHAGDWNCAYVDVGTDDLNVERALHQLARLHRRCCGNVESGTRWTCERYGDATASRHHSQLRRESSVYVSANDVDEAPRDVTHIGVGLLQRRDRHTWRLYFLGYIAPQDLASQCVRVSRYVAPVDRPSALGVDTYRIDHNTITRCARRTNEPGVPSAPLEAPLPLPPVALYLFDDTTPPESPLTLWALQNGPITRLQALLQFEHIESRYWLLPTNDHHDAARDRVSMHVLAVVFAFASEDMQRWWLDQEERVLTCLLRYKFCGYLERRRAATAAHYDLTTVRDRAHDLIGWLVDEARERMQRTLLAATAHFSREQNVDALPDTVADVISRCLEHFMDSRRTWVSENSQENE